MTNQQTIDEKYNEKYDERRILLRKHNHLHCLSKFMANKEKIWRILPKFSTIKTLVGVKQTDCWSKNELTIITKGDTAHFRKASDPC